LSEGQLLDRFLTRRDEAAFEALVARFGPMVMGVCRGLLADPNDVEDAFQATFLVLVRKAGTIRDRALIGNWLYGVAHRVASRARVDSARRRAREGKKEACDVAAPRDGFDGHDEPDLRPALHEEVARLPAKYREPVVLCYLQGQTHEEAARGLGWPVGTVKGRLSRARKLLRDRLVRRGWAVPAGAVVAALARDARGAVPELLIRDTVKAALSVAAGGAAAAGLVSATSASLAERVIKTMWIAKLKLAAAALLAFGLVASGAGVLGQSHDARGEREIALAAASENRLAAGLQGSTESNPASAEVEAAVPPSRPEKAAREAVESAAAGSADATGPLGPTLEELDPLAQERLKAAIDFLNASQAFYNEGTITIDRLISASQRLMETQRELARDPAESGEAITAHAERMKLVAERENARLKVGSGSVPNVTEAQLALAEAKYLQGAKDDGREGEGRLGSGSGAVPNSEGRQASRKPGDDHPMSRVIVAKLEDPVSMPFPNETPLGDLVKYIKSVTQTDELPNGIPIYVDPNGLQEAEMTMESPVVIELEGIPLRRTLHLALRSLGLAYTVQDGLLIISSPEGLDSILLEPTIHTVSEYRLLKDKSERGELTSEDEVRWKGILAEEAEKAKAASIGGGGMGGGFR
jgi:RNA polymerase sigma factor (sigma-70 family)